MKKLSILLFIFLISCTGEYRPLAQPVQAQGAQQTSTEYPSPTITPQPTIDYQSTVDVAQGQVEIAQATANEAMRVNAMATAQYVELMNEQIRFTAEVERQQHEIMAWTQVAAGTTIPLTATQQAALNTQIPQRNALEAAYLTATKGAPTQMIAMARAQNQLRYGKYSYFASLIASSAIFVFVLGIVVWLYNNPLMPKVEIEQEPVKNETTVWIRSDKDNGARSTRYVVPCSPEQLTELSEHITQGTKTFAINQWEGADTLFTRPIILQVRAWLRENHFAIPTGDGQLAPTHDGFNFLIAWLDTQRLPEEYEFGEDFQNSAQIPAT